LTDLVGNKQKIILNLTHLKRAPKSRLFFPNVTLNKIALNRSCKHRAT